MPQDGGQFPTIEPGATRVTPVATPVQTFVSQPRFVERQSNVDLLLSSLSSLEGSIFRHAERRRARQAEEDFLGGQAAGLTRASEGGELAAVRNDPSLASQSKAFIRGMKKSEGHAEGLRLTSLFQAEWEAWEGKDAADPEQFDAFLGEFIKRNVKTDDPDFLAGLLPQVQVLAGGAHGMFRQEQSRVIYERALGNHAAIAAQAIDQFDLEGLARTEGTDFEDLHTVLMNRRALAIRSGIRAEDFDEEYVNLVAGKALENLDRDMLGLLDKLVPGEEHAYSDTALGRNAKIKTSQLIEQAELRALVAEDKRRREVEDELEQAANLAVVQFTSANPGVPIPPDLMREWERYEPRARELGANLSNTFADRTVIERESDIAAISRSIVVEGMGREAVLAALKAGVPLRDTTVARLLSLSDTMTAEGEGVDRVVKGPLASTIRNSLLRPPGLSPEAIFDPGMAPPEHIEAYAWWEGAMIQFLERNPEATEIEIRRAQLDAFAMARESLAVAREFESQREGMHQPPGAEEIIGPSRFGVPSILPETRSLTDEEREAAKQMGLSEDEYLEIIREMEAE